MLCKQCLRQEIRMIVVSDGKKTWHMNEKDKLTTAVSRPITEAADGMCYYCSKVDRKLFTREYPLKDWRHKNKGPLRWMLIDGAKESRTPHRRS